MMSADISTSYLRSFSSGDPIVVANHVTDDFENNQMGVFGESIKGKTAYIQRLKPFLAKFKDLRYSTSNIIAEAEKVALAYDMTCSVDEHPIRMQGVMMITISDGLIRERSDYWDGLSFLMQTGMF
ncbi:MAG: hypothetical protein CBD08_000180 [Cellvibrionales bacterium TMED148]|nr:hypothetical protein [Porticoccaceae bacterium]RPG94133.1 MAG: hypothetical protein CBD08_000180 [Cellvibrionales bacterium TMED148]